MAKEVKLLGFWPSPFAIKPKIALHLKSVDYEYIEETLQSKSDLLLKTNPVYKKIPVLLHHNKPICESLNIDEYIDEAFPSTPSILPAEPYDRAIQRFWAAYIDEWFPTFREVALAQSEEVRAAAIEKVKEGLSLLEDAFVKCSKGKPFFSGDNIGYLDIALGSYLGWLYVYEKLSNINALNKEETPSLLTWAERFSAADAVKDYIPEVDKLMEFAKIIMPRFKAAASN
ncbi:glutathione S-transferase U16-like [Chenopodium quinoa]|uniref:Glutathione S-transferase n=1 Tax=Chenopodium quinoa TaxID=63459 RepID=A0A803MB22_CHEQI|nr:glutathione S-transferase U16-like [Chenopodium quinoa]